MLLALLARIAEKAQSLTMLFDTITLLARKTLMPLPFWPVPPLRAAMRSTRLPDTMVPSSAGCQRCTRMPPLAQSETLLPVICRPLGLDRIDAGVGGARNLGVLDAAGDALERDAVLAAADDLAIVDDGMARRA